MFVLIPFVHVNTNHSKNCILIILSQINNDNIQINIKIFVCSIYRSHTHSGADGKGEEASLNFEKYFLDRKSVV